MHKLLTTALEWDDLILPDRVHYEIGEIMAWVRHGAKIVAYPGVGQMIRPGYRSFFHGPPGTGKTLTAKLLGKATGREVYRINLATIVSSYIGETEKNLAKLFDQAECSNWILFFDEADALFGKRTDVSQANERYANLEVSYFLQRAQDFNGIFLMASNMRGNIDAAIARRFESLIYFPIPDSRERLCLWQKVFVDQDLLHDEVDLEAVAERHELTGGAIVNVARSCLLEMLRNDDSQISARSLDRGIAREVRKDGKTPEEDQ